VILLRQQGGQ